MMFDLLLQKGRVVDPANSLDDYVDVAIRAGRIAAVTRDPGKAADAIDCTDLIVTPGMIDLHVHCYAGVTHYGIPADETCLMRGVTTAVDAGSSGAATFGGLRRFVIEVSATRLYALLNISRIGMVTGAELDPPVGELEDLRHLNVAAAVKCIEENRDKILGVKIRLSDNLSRDGKNEMQALKLAREAADATQLPIMFHTPNSSLGLARILNEMRGGDILTHCFHGHRSGILDSGGNVLPEVHQARNAGVLFDVGHGKGSFSYSVARQAMQQGVLPDTISSDLHRYNLHGPVFDLATTLSKFLHLGLGLSDTIRRVTSNPGSVIPLPGAGELSIGAEADLVVFRTRQGARPLADTMGDTEVLAEWIEPAYVIKAGQVVARHSLTED